MHETAPRHFPITNRYPGPTVAVDLDGTLAPHADGDSLGAPHAGLVAMLRRLGWSVVIFSARPPAHHPLVAAWVKTHGLDDLIDQIALGSKPAADLFIDDKGLLPPLVALEEHAERLITPPAQRAQRIASGARTTLHGVQTQDCHENPAWSGVEQDPDHMVVVPLSGGMDSLTAWAMAEAAGLAPQAVYIDTGAPYSATEIEVCRRFAPALEVVAVPVDYTRWDYVDAGRNEIIVWACAELIRSADRWGSVWFGNTAEWQETPIVGGDKTLRFFSTMQQLLTLGGYDVQLISPLVGMTKADLVRWWEARGQLDRLLGGRSCYGAEGGHCGRCRSCFRRWLAFSVAGYRREVEATYPAGIDFDPHIASYRAADRSRVTMAPGRTAEIDRFLNSLTHGKA